MSKELVNSVLAECQVNTVFSQNAKMRKSSQNDIHLYNWGIPAYKSNTGVITCPNASKCISGCYAKSGAYLFSNVAKAYESRLKLTQHVEFKTVIKYHIDKLLKKHKTGQVLIRIHDSGDFYSPEYLEAWCSIARQYHNETRLKFYAYTKMVQLCKDHANIPNNLILIYSFGGRQDELINVNVDRHSFVFETVEHLELMGYSNASQDDTIALGVNNKIGLVYHGTKLYSNTTWNRVGKK